MMEVCVNGNSSTPSFEWSTCQPAQPSTARPKRDFRFQVIEVRQHPKWFIWPSRNRGNEEEVDENHNKEAKTVGMENDYQQANCSSQNQYATYTKTQNGYGTKRRNVLRGSKRTQMEKDGVPGRTASEPARRLSTKKDKATTEPLPSGGLSNTFKILSIAKKWDSFDATDDESDDATMSCAGVNKMAKGTADGRLSSGGTLWPTMYAIKHLVAISVAWLLYISERFPPLRLLVHYLLLVSLVPLSVSACCGIFLSAICGSVNEDWYELTSTGSELVMLFC